jgi:hypothetical protein
MAWSAWSCRLFGGVILSAAVFQAERSACPEQSRRDLRPGRSRSNSATTTRIIPYQRQLPYPVSRRGEDGVAQRWNKRRHPGLSHPRGRCDAFDDVNIDLPRRVVHSRDLVVVEIRLVDRAIRRGDLAGAGDAGAEHSGAFELLANHLFVTQNCLDLRSPFSAPTT